MWLLDVVSGVRLSWALKACRPFATRMDAIRLPGPCIAPFRAQLSHRVCAFQSRVRRSPLWLVPGYEGTSLALRPTFSIVLFRPELGRLHIKPEISFLRTLSITTITQRS
jgi:hypothetical protein